LWCVRGILFKSSKHVLCEHSVFVQYVENLKSNENPPIYGNFGDVRML